MNRDEQLIEDFGREWSLFDQTGASHPELKAMFETYFSVFPWECVSGNAEGFDLGCGSGRWARFVAPRVGVLHCIEPSEAALQVARRALVGSPNCVFHNAAVDQMPLREGTADFGYSLGVLHHVPDTDKALRECVKVLRVGAPFLLYLYYRFENRSYLYRGIWRLSDAIRQLVSRGPYALRVFISQLVALTVYWPLARAAKVGASRGLVVSEWPLSFYRDKSVYMMRTDALDRFATRLEKRFTREEVEEMMREAGLGRIRFMNEAPYWCAVGYRVW